MLVFIAGDWAACVCYLLPLPDRWLSSPVKPLSHHWYPWLLSLVDTCRLVGTVHLHKYWLLVRFPSTKAKRNSSCLLTKPRLSVASTNVCQMLQSCEQYDTYSLGLLCNAQLLARFTNTPLVGTRIKRLTVKFWTGLCQYHMFLATFKSSWTNACMLSFGCGTQGRESG